MLEGSVDRRKVKLQRVLNEESKSVNVLAFDKHAKLSMVTSLSDPRLRGQRLKGEKTNKQTNKQTNKNCLIISIVQILFCYGFVLFCFVFFFKYVLFCFLFWYQYN